MKIEKAYRNVQYESIFINWQEFVPLSKKFICYTL